MKALACMFTQACAKLYKKTSYNLRLSQRPLRSARQRASMDRVVTISVNRNHDAVMVKEPDPPPQGGWTVMACGKQRRARDKLPKYHRKNPACP